MLGGKKLFEPFEYRASVSFVSKVSALSGNLNKHKLGPKGFLLRCDVEREKKKLSTDMTATAHERVDWPCRHVGGDGRAEVDRETSSPRSIHREAQPVGPAEIC